MTDISIAICDYCRVAVPIAKTDRPAWDAKHLHTDDSDGDDL